MKLKSKVAELDRGNPDEIERSDWFGVSEHRLQLYYLAQILKTLKSIEAKLSR